LKYRISLQIDYDYELFLLYNPNFSLPSSEKGDIPPSVPLPLEQRETVKEEILPQSPISGVSVLPPDPKRPESEKNEQRTEKYQIFRDF
jgi:hypothetical protein